MIDCSIVGFFDWILFPWGLKGYGTMVSHDTWQQRQNIYRSASSGPCTTVFSFYVQWFVSFMYTVISYYVQQYLAFMYNGAGIKNYFQR